MQCRRLSLTTRLTGKRKALDRLKDAPDPRAKAPELHKTIQDTSKGIAKLVRAHACTIMLGTQLISACSRWRLHRNM